MNCLCGESGFDVIQREYYRVTEIGETIKADANGVLFGKCNSCGIIRQINPPFSNDKEYLEFYKKYEPSFQAYAAKNYEHDRKLAKLRCQKYGIKQAEIVSVSLPPPPELPPVPKPVKLQYRLTRGTHIMGNRTLKVGDIIEMTPHKAQFMQDRFELVQPFVNINVNENEDAIEQSKGYRERIMDIGSGSGAFVDECRKLEHEAYGCEITKYSYAQNHQYTYQGKFEELHFPTDHFDRITCHDILEHSLNPARLLSEVFRSLKQEGICNIDFPNYFAEEGKHHWKIEHVWYFTPDDLKKILIKTGFVIKEEKYPILSKITITATKPKQTRIKILYPPGIGDSYWSIIKTQAFLDREKIKAPVDVGIACPRDKEFDGHKRAFPFVEMFPFLNATGKTFANNMPESRAIWLEAYRDKGRTIFKDIGNHDYFISYNGHLRHGEQMELIDLDLQCNWNPEMFVSLEQMNYQNECIQKYEKYIVFYFVFQGTYKYWTNEFPIDKVIKSVQMISEKTKCTPVFAGAVWDQKRDGILSNVKSCIPNCIDLTGQTSLPQALGLMKGSQAVVGYPSGLTVVSAMLGVKTLIIWNNYYNKDFFWYACPPSVRNKTYFIENTLGLTEQKLTQDVLNLLG